MRISRRRFVARGLAIATAGFSINRGRVSLAEDGREIQISTRAIDLIRETPVIDMLGLFTFDWPRLYSWYRRPTDFTELDFRFLESSGISIFHPAVNTTAGNPHSDAQRWLAGWARLLQKDSCFLSLIATPADLMQVPDSGTLGVIMGFQNSEHFRQPDDVELFFDLGQRVSQLTYNGTNRLGSGCLAGTDSGLSAFGATVVETMNRVGMAIDVSHCGERTSLDALRHSTQPVLITHSNCRALNPRSRRCKSDLVLEVMAKSGGVVGLTAVGRFVRRRGPATIDHYLDHFEHAIRLVGPEHVGIGSDLDTEAIDPKTGRRLPGYSIAGLEPRLRIFQLVDRLLARGYLAKDIRLILGENFRRVLSQIWGAGSTTHPQGSQAANRRRDPFCPASKRPRLAPDLRFLEPGR